MPSRRFIGPDSLIEVSSCAALLRRLHMDAPGRIALKLVGVSLLLLAAYITFDPIKSFDRLKFPPLLSGVRIVQPGRALHDWYAPVGSMASLPCSMWRMMPSLSTVKVARVP